MRKIITHITNGNKNEERLVEIMGGTVIETGSERLMRVGAGLLITETGRSGCDGDLASRALALSCGSIYQHSERRTDQRSGKTYGLEIYKKDLEREELG